MLLHLALLVSLSPLIFAAKCSVKNGKMSARWQVLDGELTMEVTTKSIGNNEWSAIGFGPDMSDLEVVVFKIVDNQPKIETGFTQGYGAPTLDSSPNINLQSLNYNSNRLVARFSRPLDSNGSRSHSLSSCSTWNFVQDGTIEDGELGYHNSPPHSVEICASKCTSKIIH